MYHSENLNTTDITPQDVQNGVSTISIGFGKGDDSSNLGDIDVDTTQDVYDNERCPRSYFGHTAYARGITNESKKKIDEDKSGNHTLNQKGKMSAMGQKTKRLMMTYAKNPNAPKFLKNYVKNDGKITGNNAYVWINRIKSGKQTTGDKELDRLIMKGACDFLTRETSAANDMSSSEKGNISQKTSNTITPPKVSDKNNNWISSITYEN